MSSHQSNKLPPLKIALLGAAFDPPHYAHVALAYLTIKTQDIQQIWLCPSPDRWDKKCKAPFATRCIWVQKMCEILNLHQLPVSLCDNEGNPPRPYRGTYVFLKELQKLWPQHQFSLIVGSDSFESMPQWRDATNQKINGPKLIAETSIFVAERGNKTNERPKLKISPKLHFLDSFESHENSLFNLTSCTSFELNALSSTFIRQEIAKNKNSELNFCFREIEKLVVESGIYCTDSNT